MSRLRFKLEAEARGSSARAARFTTLHGEVMTPLFMPVGTQATVRSQTVRTLKEAGSRILLANTYHLLRRPGPEVMKRFNGIHRFMNWDGPVLTDSGGYQVFSLQRSCTISEEGAAFLNELTNQPLLLSPEVSIQTQKAIGSDIMMAMDHCIASTASHAEAREAMERTHRWARRSLAARGDSPQALFGIVQGACHEDLRRESAKTLTSLEAGGASFDGFAIGGLAVGESKAEREDFTELAAGLLPRELPRYLMGVGTPIDLLEAVHRGVDLFDCILPAQNAQRGVAFTSAGKLQLRRGVYKFSEDRLDPDCGCDTCAHYSRAYLHHLRKTEEPLGWHLLTLHNLTFYHRLMREIRASILEDRFESFYREKRELLVRQDEENPSTPLRPRRLTRAEKNRRLGEYEVHLSPQGFSSIRHSRSGEIMHSVNPPEVEARTLYLEPSRLRERIRRQERTVIWDVGLGAATNAMAVVQEAMARSPESTGEIELVSFEIDLDPLRLAIRNAGSFPHVRHPAPVSLLRDGLWRNERDRCTWRLLPGDFRERLVEAPVPDVIFYDPFSRNTNPELWGHLAFKRLRERLGGHPSQLLTYSASTAVRAALLANGFFVAYGAAAGPKATTTMAYTSEHEARESGTLLGREWLERWGRSLSRFPPDLAPEAHPAFERAIREHPQFRA